MNLSIRPLNPDDIDALIQLSLATWEPVFESFLQILGPNRYSLIWPDWKSSQSEEVEKVCKDAEETTVMVAEVNGSVVGYLAYKLDHNDKTGEIHLLAVHPDHQNQGIGTELNLAALGEMTERGMKMAVVGTGADPSHAPARKSYEKAGFTGLPLVRYYKDL